MLVDSDVKSGFLTYPTALLIILIFLLISSCGPLKGVLDNSQSTSLEEGKPTESRKAAQKRDVNRSGSDSDMLGSKQDVAVITPDGRLSGQGNGTQSALKGSLKQLIREGYTLKDGIEKEYRSHRRENTFELHARDLTRGWSLKVAQWAGKAEDVLQEFDFVALAQFKVYRGPTVPRGEDKKWGTIDNWLNDKLHFLETCYDKLGKR